MSVYIKSMATANIANKPTQAIHLYFYPTEIKLAATAIRTIDKTRPKTNK